VTAHDLRSREDAVSLIENIEASQWPKEVAAPQASTKKPSSAPKQGRENPQTAEAGAGKRGSQ
jgi:hypothetical protein